MNQIAKLLEIERLLLEMEPEARKSAVEWFSRRFSSGTPSLFVRTDDISRSDGTDILEW